MKYLRKQFESYYQDGKLSDAIADTKVWDYIEWLESQLTTPTDDKGLEERARDFYIKQYKLHQGINPFPWTWQDSEAVAMLQDFARSLNQQP